MTPKKNLSALDVAFGQINGLMPSRAQLNAYRSGWGEELFATLFYRGGSVAHLKAKDGIDFSDAIKHIRAIMGSFEPKHEDKTAACGYLFELWFEKPPEKAA